MMKEKKKEQDIEVYTPEEIAEKLRVDPATVRRWLREGQVRGLKLGRQWRIEKAEYEAFLERKRSEHPK